MCLFGKKQSLQIDYDSDDSSNYSIVYTRSRKSTSPQPYNPRGVSFHVQEMPAYVPSSLLPPAPSEERTIVYPYYPVPAPAITYSVPTITYGPPAAPKVDNSAIAQKIAESLVDTKPPSAPSAPYYTTTTTTCTTYQPSSPTSARDYKRAEREYLEAQMQLKQREQELEEDRSRTLLQITAPRERRARSVSVSSSGRSTRLVIEERERRCRVCGGGCRRGECEAPIRQDGVLVVLPAESHGHRRSRSTSYREAPRDRVRYIRYGDDY